MIGKAAFTVSFPLLCTEFDQWDSLPMLSVILEACDGYASTYEKYNVEAKEYKKAALKYQK